MITLQEASEKVIDDFDFNTVHSIMQLLNWKWVLRDRDEFVVPSIQDMKNLCRDRLDEMIKKKIPWIAVGGFEFSIEEDKVSIKFVLKQSQYYYD